jgi:hypothetical protein
MSAKKKVDSVGVRLLAGLTETEIGQLLDALLQALPPEDLEQSLSQLSGDTQQTIRQILSPPPSKKQKQQAPTAATLAVSLAKLSQTWSQLWQDWEAIVWEASEEDGQYIEQEAHWEPPYLDNYAFAQDLDKVATKMLPLVPVAFEHGFTPDRGFAPALLEAEAEILGGIPDWIEMNEGISLEAHTTECWLQWEWLSAQNAGQDAFQLAQHLRQLEADFSTRSRLFDDHDG